jgi:hypothetical protein
MLNFGGKARCISKRRGLHLFTEHRYDGEDCKCDRDTDVTESGKSSYARKFEPKQSSRAGPTDFADSRFHGYADYVRLQALARAKGHPIACGSVEGARDDRMVRCKNGVRRSHHFV